MRLRTFVIAIVLLATTTSLAQQTIYWKKDHVYNGPGGKEIAVMMPTPTDSTAPSAPTSLTVTSSTSTSVGLSWTGSTDSGGSGLAGYKVYRQQGTGASLPVGTVTGTTFTDEPLTPSTSFTYTVRAFDNGQNHSSASGSVNVTTSGYSALAPSAPSNLRGSAINSKTIRLDWQASTDRGGPGVAGYTVSRNGSVVSGASPITTTYFQDTGLTANTSYSYSVTATDNSSNVSSDATLSVSTPRAIAFKDDFARPDGAPGSMLYPCQYQMANGYWSNCWGYAYSWVTLAHHATVPVPSGWAIAPSYVGFTGDIKTTVTLTSNPMNAGIYFWDDYPYQGNPTMQWYVAYVSGTTLKLSYMTYPASETVLATASVGSSIGTISIEGTPSTRLIEVSLNGTVLITYTETNTSRPNRGRVGMWAANPSAASGNVLFDNFILEN